uniref:Fasciculation and elongation protein zeta-2-like n=1 Tax=Gouania willdenowi TaxID=441366 RepID=A0A8C5ESF2_GOUWI
MAAPIAHFDEDWPCLGTLSSVSEQVLRPNKGGAAEEAAASLLEVDGGGGDDPPELQHGSFSLGEPGGFTSMEDLVNGFEEKLSVCFRNFNVKAENIAPVSAITEDGLLEKDGIWTALTSNYGRVMPVNWEQSRIHSLHMTTLLSQEEKPRQPEATVELLDDEELRDQLDMHTIIVSCLAEEPILTAEQVIEEIEEMMQDSPDMDAEHNPSQSDLSMLSLDIQGFSFTSDLKDRVRTLSVAELNKCLEETEGNIRRFSEVLVQHLALRDELDFEKEVKNGFISALIDVENQQKEHQESVKRKKKLKARAGTSQSHGEKTLGSYLTTVIPYEKKGHPPSIEDLQILTKSKFSLILMMEPPPQVSAHRGVSMEGGIGESFCLQTLPDCHYRHYNDVRQWKHVCCFLDACTMSFVSCL